MLDWSGRHQAKQEERLMNSADPLPLAELRAAQTRLARTVLRTPLVRLQVEEAPAEIYLKLENLQPIGSFKLRGASNALLLASPEQLADGVWTASAGNMAQGVAWQARRMGLPCTIVVPDHAPETKLAAIRRVIFGNSIRSVESWPHRSPPCRLSTTPSPCFPSHQ
jgi:threonine dehydratase